MKLRLANNVQVSGSAPHQLGGVCAGAEMTNMQMAVTAACLLPSFFKSLNL